MRVRTPVQRAVVAAAYTLVLGIVLSWVAVRVGWAARIEWLAAAVVPLSVGVVVYTAARRERR
jgi:hypothetical protein